MGVEELSIVQMIVKILNQRPTPQGLADKVKGILDEKTDEFVHKLW